MRSLFLLINVVALLLLGILAKDNVLAEVRGWFLDELASPQKLSASANIEVAFSPNQGATASIVRAIKEARQSILVSAYNFTSKDLAEALLDAKKRQVVVKLILDKSQVSQRYSSLSFFINMGFDVRIDVKHAIYHNKVMIIDDKTVVTGSFNFTKAAESKNAENVLIIRDNPSLAKTYSENWRFHWQRSLSRAEFLSQNKS